ncbi:mariner Mos1 transposase [Trichonephila clavipes]|nr:mariner Mos1 transposase [Trichonephila clavipes]
MFDSSSYDSPTPLAHIDTSRDVLPRGAVQIDRKAESLRLQDNAVYFLGSGGTNLFYELLKPDETVNAVYYKQQLLNLNDAILEKREQYKKRQHKVIFLDDNAPSHRAKPTKDIVKALGWDPLTHAAYFQTWLLPITAYLHHWDTHWLTSASLLTKTLNLGLMTGWFQKTDHFLAWFHKLPKRWGKYVASDRIKKY